jgi:catechol 2,3-dioxygenase-like lactoylglutathione lyase family enzyme
MRGWRFTAFALSAVLAASATAIALAQTPRTGRAPPPPGPPPPPPVVAGAHWHHIELNATDPARDIEFYTTHFLAKAAEFDGRPAVWTQKSWMLFHKVKTAPPHRLNTAIWHFGWGTENAPAEYKRQQSLGARFFTELTDISDIGGRRGAPGSFWYMYVEGPDRALIELNTASHHHFGHIHMFSADPVAAGDWYIRMFGVRGRYQGPDAPRTVRMYRGSQIGPSASIYFDNVNMIIYPVEYAKQNYPDDWKGVSQIQATRGTITDHIGFSVPNLTDALTRLKAQGVKVTDPPRSGPGGKYRYAFIEGPDRMAIELIEDHTGHPPLEDKD